jgi:peroxiredoxin Q/BCP
MRWDGTIRVQETSHISIIRMIALKPGDRAPHFSVIDDADRTVSLTDFAGHTVVLFFYPKDDTAG